MNFGSAVHSALLEPEKNEIIVGSKKYLAQKKIKLKDLNISGQNIIENSEKLLFDLADLH